MPQLSQAADIYASQLFWLVIVFALIYFGIGKAMVPRIERTIDDRSARISGDLAAAEAARARAAADEQTYQSGLDTARSQAAKLVGEAQANATSNAEARLKATDAAAETKMAETMTGIEHSKRDALAGVEAAAVEAVQAIVAKLSGIEVDRAAAARRVKEALAHG